MNGTQTVVVTGANGFVGRQVTAALSVEGFRVMAVVRRAAPGPRGSDVIAVGDVRHVADWARIVAGADAVVHLAGRAHVLRDRAVDQLTEYRQTNVLATERLARGAVEAGVRRFVFVSTIGVHGTRTPDSHSWNEQDEPAPVTPYAVSKLEAERALFAIAQRSALEAVVLRPTLVYGPDAPGNLRLLMRLISTGLPLPLAAIRNRRSFLAVENLASLVVCALKAPQAAGIFMAADEDVVSTPQVARSLAQGMGKSVRLVRVPPILIRSAALLLGRPSAAQSLCDSLTVDATRARRELNWVPQIRTLEGLVRTGSQHALRARS